MKIERMGSIGSVTRLDRTPALIISRAIDAKRRCSARCGDRSSAPILNFQTALRQDSLAIATRDYGTTRNQNRTDGAKYGAAPPIDARGYAADCHPRR